jgi:hypothetical protein
LLKSVTAIAVEQDVHCTAKNANREFVGSRRSNLKIVWPHLPHFVIDNASKEFKNSCTSNSIHIEDRSVNLCHPKMAPAIFADLYLFYTANGVR